MIIDCTNVENPYKYVGDILKEEITKKEGCRCPGTYIVNIETDACGCCNTVMDWDSDDSIIWEDDWWEGGPIIKVHGYIEICKVTVPNNLSNDEIAEKYEPMIIQTWAKDNEDLGLLCNTLNAQAGRFIYSDPNLYAEIIRAQAAIAALEELFNTGKDKDYAENDSPKDTEKRN